MTGFNMPPGCSPSDIPGNTPEAADDEALMETIYEILNGFADSFGHEDYDVLLEIQGQKIFDLIKENQGN